MILVFLADGFEEIEALTPVDYLRRAGIAVTTVGVGRQTVTGSHGIPVTADTQTELLDDTIDFDGVVLPGGMPGTLNLEGDSVVMHFVKKAADENKMLSAICAAPSILGHAGILKGKNAICFPGFENDLYGAKIDSECSYVVTDGNIITGRGAGVADEFAFALIAYIKGTDAALSVRSQIQCR